MKFVESAQVELKERINTDLKKEIVAFANTDGGEIIIGGCLCVMELCPHRQVTRPFDR